MSLLLPTWQNSILGKPNGSVSSFEELTDLFTSRLHWEFSSAMTTHHLLAMVSLTNTLMSMKMASFLEKYQALLAK